MFLVVGVTIIVNLSSQGDDPGFKTRPEPPLFGISKFGGLR